MQLSKLWTNSKVSFLFILVYIIICVTPKEMPTPYCIVEINSVNYACEIKNVTTGIISPFHDIDDFSLENVDEDNLITNHINTSNQLVKLEKEMNLYLYDKKGVTESFWLINLLPVLEKIDIDTNSQLVSEKCFKLNNSVSIGILHLNFLPVTENYVSYELTYNNYFKETNNACNKSDTFCSAQLWPITSSKMINLIAKTPFRMSLNIRLFVGRCNFSCSDLNDCEMDSYDFICPKVDARHNSVYIFDHLNPSFYCVVVNSVGNDCCSFGTETVHLEDSSGYKTSGILVRDNRSLEKDFISKSVLLMFIFIMFTVLIVLFRITYVYFQNADFEQLPPNSAPDNESSDAIQIKSSPQERVEILLIYSRESEEFVHKMKELTTYLQFYVGKVWDPLGNNEKDFIVNPFLVIQLLQKNVKVVLVSNEEGLKREKELLETAKDSMVEPYRLKEIFTYVLSTVYSNPGVYNHRRLFVASYDENYFHYAVPCTRYFLPRQIDYLIRDIKN